MPRAKGQSTVVYTPAVTRHRAKIESDKKPPCSVSESSPTLVTDIMPADDMPVENMNMKEVLKHIEMLQERTESNMAASIEQAVDKSKKEINENIDSLSQSILSIRSDFSSFEQKYNEKFETIESKILESAKKSDLACSEVKKVEQIVRSVNRTNTDKLKYIEEDTVALKKSMNKELAGLRSELSRTQREHQLALEKQSHELTLWKEQLEQSMNDIRIKSYGNTNLLRQYTTLVDNIDNKVRANNIVIEGHPEQMKEDGTLIDDVPSDVSALIQKSIVDFDDTNIKMLIRLGQPKKKGSKKPRPLLVGLANQAVREKSLRAPTILEINLGINISD